MSAMHALSQTFDSPQSSEEELIACLDAAAGGDYMRRPSGNDAVSQAVSRLLNSMENRCSAELRNVVDISVSMNETAFMSAYLLHDLRGVDDVSQSIAAAAEEMAATVGEIGKHGDEIFGYAKSASATAAASAQAVTNASAKMDVVSEVMSKTEAKIGDIQTLARRIDEISSNIRKIASQTNLLAINAAVEAARAGDAGRGFAVVAAEVKSLSDRTATATEEIANIVRDLHSGTDAMVQSMSQSAAAAVDGKQATAELETAIGEMESRVRDVTGSAEQISEALHQQRVAAAEVASGVSKVATNSADATRALEKIVSAMDGAQKVITQQIGRISDDNIPNKVIKLAQSDHIIWKKRLANMIVGLEGLRANELSDHHSCRLGKWYYQASDARSRGRPEFAQLEEPHILVHQHGIAAVKRFNDGDTEGALAEIAEVDAASRNVLNLLRSLER